MSVPSESEFQIELEERRLLASFISGYRGDSAHMKKAWDAFKVLNHGGESPPRRVGFDCPQHPENHTADAPRPSIEELLDQTKTLLRIHNRLQGFIEPAPFTVPEKFAYRKKGDTYIQPPTPSNWVGDEDFIAPVRERDHAAEERSIRAMVEADFEEKLNAEMAKSKILNPPKPKPTDKHFTVL